MKEKELDYLNVLKALEEIPFGVGRTLLIEFLQGDETNDSIIKNNLSSKESFGSMGYDDKELHDILNDLLKNEFIELNSINNSTWKVLELTTKGRKEIRNPSLNNKKQVNSFNETETKITEDDKKLFAAFKDFLKDYNEEQKKSIVSNKENILCIAGAGSGKTAVLTKRIEFLVKYRSVNPNKILAITFTRKARQEMINRLENIGNLSGVNVETFNSFCEKKLIKYNDLMYKQNVRVISYRDKIVMINKALISLNMTINQAIDVYFTPAQKRNKIEEQLANIFLNDCFFVRDYFKFKNSKIELIQNKQYQSGAKLIFSVCKFIEEYMIQNGLRDFADQLIDTISLFEDHKDLIPEFEHILIDEYQDINSVQIRLIDLLYRKNIFCVGDPRQSIFGWRGSDIRYIIGFKDKYPDYQNIVLTKNYRSIKPIVDLINNSIKDMGLADLNSDIDGTKDIKLLKFDSEENEFEFVIHRILAANVPRNEIFVLARTNRQLNELSQLMKVREIKHVVRSDEVRKIVLATEEDITLATIHAIKGLEAKMVFIIGCTSLNFPCKGSERPIIDSLIIEDYDKEAEEKRLFYVAMSRAKNSLYLTYSGKRYTDFITDSMLKIIDHINPEKSRIPDKQTTLIWKENVNSSDLVTRLKSWRSEISKEQGVPAYIIMNDQTMIEIANKMPNTKGELQLISGLGVTKIMRFGDQILRIVNEC